jgi:peptidoglycan/LPS O-acetylase OafA/YrhL
MACLVGFGIALALRIYLLAEFGLIRDVVENTFARMDSLLAGAACASMVRSPHLLKRIRPRIGPVGLAAACILAFGLPAFFEPGLFMQSVGYSALAILFAAIVLSAFLGRDGTGSAERILERPMLTSLGKYSYGIYVYHVPVLMASFAALASRVNIQRSTWLSVAFTITAALTIYGIAKLSYEFFEKRFLRLKVRFKPVFAAESSPLATPPR